MSNTIGLCLALKTETNYGAILQAYATQQIVEEFGFCTEIIDYTSKGDKGIIKSPEYYLSRIINRIRGNRHKKRTETLDEVHKQNREMRIRKADEFRNARLHSIVHIQGYDALVGHSKQYKAVVVGSDQLWPPTVVFTCFRTLRFVPAGVRRISYATSMGADSYPWYTKRLAAQFLSKIDYLSVREEQAKKIINDVCDRDAKVVLDPTYLISKDDWKLLIPNESVTNNGYVLLYFLGDNPEMKRLAKLYARKRGLRVVSIMSSESNVDDGPYADEILTGQSPEQFLNLVRNAECVFTDSFHGFAFSVINEKQVYITYRVRKGTYSRNSRIDNIVQKFGMEDRLIKDPSSIEELDDSETDYNSVNEKLRALREDSLAFLKSALDFSREEPMDKHALFEHKYDCCGCEACANACPKGIIEMSADEEGFYYPHVTDPESCIECDACHTVCPVTHANELNSKFDKAFAGWAKDESDITASSSGGFAAVLTDTFLKNGGVVYGVAYNEDYTGAKYIRISSREQADRLRTSKYFQARKNDVYKQVREDLKTSDVLFTGVPCDIYALKRFIRDDSRLYTLSVICHGPTSEKVHQLYCSAVETKLGCKISDFTVRFKKDGNWKPYYIRTAGENGKVILEQFNKTDYNTAFLYFKRPACGACRFKNNHFAADILVGDYHAASKGSSVWNAHGVSAILPLTDKGKKLLESVDNVFIYNEVPLRTAISQQGVHSPVIKDTNRDEFAAKMNTVGLHVACRIASVKKDLNHAKAKKRRAAVIRPIKKAIKTIIHR